MRRQVTRGDTIIGFHVPSLRSTLAALAWVSFPAVAPTAWAADISDRIVSPIPSSDEAVGAMDRDVNLTSVWPGDDIDIKLGYSKLLKADVIPTTIVVGNEEVVEVAPVGNMLILTGKALGSTNLFLLDEQKEVLLGVVVEVVPVLPPRPIVRVFEGGREPIEYACGDNACALAEDPAASTAGAADVGSCMRPDDIAADGSRCGDRAASTQPGSVDGEGRPE